LPTPPLVFPTVKIIVLLSVIKRESFGNPKDIFSICAGGPSEIQQHQPFRG
jgi:hypothetical protein